MKKLAARVVIEFGVVALVVLLSCVGVHAKLKGRAE